VTVYASIWSQTSKLAEQPRKWHNGALYGLYSECSLYSGCWYGSGLWKKNWISKQCRTTLCCLLYWHHWLIQHCHLGTCLDPGWRCHLVWGVLHNTPQMSPLHWTHAPKLQGFHGMEVHSEMRSHIVDLLPGDGTACHQCLKNKFVSCFSSEMFTCWPLSIQNI
jgi:hypothetical protein